MYAYKLLLIVVKHYLSKHVSIKAHTFESGITSSRCSLNWRREIWIDTSCNCGTNKTRSGYTTAKIKKHTHDFIRCLKCGILIRMSTSCSCKQVWNKTCMCCASGYLLGDQKFPASTLQHAYVIWTNIHLVKHCTSLIFGVGWNNVIHEFHRASFDTHKRTLMPR